jgi:hypothetical protein
VKTWAKYIYYQFKLLPAANVAACLLIIAAAPIIFSLRMLSFKEAADIGELYISLCGVILLPSVYFAEKDMGTAEVVYTKRDNPSVPQLVRLLIALTIITICICIFTSLALLEKSSFDITEMAAGILITAAAMGVLGYTTGTFTGNPSLAYLISFAWYGFELLTSGKYTGDLYLFSLRRGDLTAGKMAIGAAAFIVVIIDMVYTGFSKNRLKNMDV